MSDRNRQFEKGAHVSVDDDDDIEIIEVVGLEEDEDGDPLAVEDDEEIVFSLDDDEPTAIDVTDEDVFDDAAAVARLMPLEATPEPETEPEPSPAVATTDPEISIPPTPAAAPPTPDGSKSVSDREYLVRLQADFENFKKRTERERVRQEREANATLIKSMLPILDNFERALCADAGNGENNLRDGVVLIFRQVLDEFRKQGLQAVEAVGRPFDPNVHEAVETDPDSNEPPHTVVAELRRGYMLAGRLLRPALVRVAVDPEEQGNLGTSHEESDNG